MPQFPWLVYKWGKKRLIVFGTRAGRICLSALLGVMGRGAMRAIWLIHKETPCHLWYQESPWEKDSALERNSGKGGWSGTRRRERGGGGEQPERIAGKVFPRGRLLGLWGQENSVCRGALNRYRLLCLWLGGHSIPVKRSSPSPGAKVSFCKGARGQEAGS